MCMCKKKNRRNFFYIIYFGKGENTLFSKVVGKDTNRIALFENEGQNS